MWTTNLLTIVFVIFCLFKPSTPNTNIVLWLSNHETWERDYIHELFPSNSYLHVPHKEYIEKYNSTTITTKEFWPRIFVYNVENSGNDGRYEVVREYINRFMPAILVHLSDEFQGWSKKWKYGEGVEVYKYVPLVLRQYSVKPYVSYAEPRSNVVQIPLGYMKSMLLENGSLQSSLDIIRYSNDRKSVHRNITWSFIGEIRAHKDRRVALDTFSSWTPHFVDAGITPIEMRKAYNSSLFVIVGRGQQSLDCLKVYEAMICGAIPIVVGDSYELSWTFEFDGDHPPLLYAESFPAALSKCRNMTYLNIDEQRNLLTEWYTRQVHLVRRKVDHIINKFAVFHQ